MRRRKSGNDLVASPGGAKSRWRVGVCQKCLLVSLCCLVGVTFAWHSVVPLALQGSGRALKQQTNKVEDGEGLPTWAAPAQNGTHLEVGQLKEGVDTNGSVGWDPSLAESGSAAGTDQDAEDMEQGQGGTSARLAQDSPLQQETGPAGSGVWAQPEGSRYAPCIDTEAQVPAVPRGYLVVHPNGGLNQMRLGIADMVAIAQVLGAALVVPQLDAKSFWRDNSTFEELFDLPFFIEALRDDVQVVPALPPELKGAPIARKHFKTWSDLDYYTTMIAPLWQDYKVISVAKTDTTLANSGLPAPLQKLRCKVAFHALRFAPPLRTLAERLVRELRARGPFVALHLRYEKDVLAFSGCTHGLPQAAADQLTAVRLATPQWRVKEIDPVEARRSGRCPLSPAEVGLTLRALGFARDTVIYLASGQLFGGPDALAPLRKDFPNLVTKESLVEGEQLTTLQAHMNQGAAVDYVISVASDVFVASFPGNMAKAVGGHRRFAGHRKSVHLQGTELIPILDDCAAGKLDADACSQQLAAAQGADHGQARVRVEAVREVAMSRQERRKDEEYFYANPLPECLCAGAKRTRDLREPVFMVAL